MPRSASSQRMYSVSRARSTIAVDGSQSFSGGAAMTSAEAIVGRAPEWRNWHTRSAQNRLPSRACGFESHLRHRSPSTPVQAAGGPSGAGSGRGGGAVLGWGPGAVVFAGADQAFLLDVPLLVEAVDRGGGDDDLQQGEDHDQEADQRRRDQPFFEEVLVAGEPAVGADRAEDREDHRQRGGDREDAAVPTEDEEREERVHQAVDEGDDPHPGPARHQREAGDRHQAGEDRGRGEQEDEHELGRDRLGFLPVWGPELVPRPYLSHTHADDHRI